MSKFTQLSQGEVQFLVSLGLGRTEWAVYCCMSAHAHNESTSYPNIETIRKWIGGHVKRNAIEKAIKKLSDKGAIERGHKTSKKRWKLVYRRKNPFVSKELENTSNMEGFLRSDGSNMEGLNTSNMEGLDTSNMEGIIDQEKREIKINSISEDGNVNLEEWILKDRINSDPLFHAQCILQKYEAYSQLTGNVFSEQERRVISNQLKLPESESHKRELIRVTIANWLENPFRKKTK